MIGCSDQQASTPDLSTLPTPAPKPTPEPAQPPQVAPPLGLTPLPTTAQVQGSVRRGRVDPFAPLVGGAGTAGGRTGADGATGSISVQGVLAVGPKLQALVRTASGSGAVCLGQAGLCVPGQAPLLPNEWSVLSIDLQRGCLTYAVEGKAQAPVCIEASKA